MEYGLLPVAGCLAFLILLLMVFNRSFNIRNEKVKKSTSVVYNTFLIISILYGLFNIAAICVLKYTSVGDGLFFTILWRISYMLLLHAFALLFIYGFAYVYKLKETNIFKILFANKDTKFIFVEAFLVTVFFTLPIHIKGVDFVTVENIIFINPRSAIFMMILLSIASLFYIIRILRFKSELKNEFVICNVVSFVGMALTFIIHIFYNESSLMIITLMIIGFIYFYLIENPDLNLLEEAKKLNAAANDALSNRIDFLNNIDVKLLDDIKEMKRLSKEMNSSSADNQVKNENIKLINSKGKKLLEDIEVLFNSSIAKDSIVLSKDYNTVDLINELKVYMVSNLSGKKIKLFMNLSEKLSKKYVGDYDKIYNSILSILSYCIDVTEFGRITININVSKADQDLIEFRIVDTSVGLQQEEALSVFEKNQKLYLAKQMVEMIGGYFSFSSTYRIGNVFTIRFKQRPTGNELLGNINEYKNNSENNSISDLSQRKILIVDDDKKVANLTKRVMSKYGFNITVVNTSSECIDLVKSDENFDIIFMDIVMKDIDGIDTLHILHDLEGYNIPKIVALTANAMPGMKEKYLNEGFDDYLSKPLDRKELERVLGKFLS